MPFFKVPRETVRQPEFLLESPYDYSDPLSSIPLWRYLFRDDDHRGRRPIAVIFALPPECWPVEVYLEVAPDNASQLIERLSSGGSGGNKRPKGFYIPDDKMESLKTSTADGCYSEVVATAESPDAVGFLLREWLATGATVRARFDESVEVVIRRPVPAGAIQRLIPLSQTNQEARARRDGETLDRDSGYDA